MHPDVRQSLIDTLRSTFRKIAANPPPDDDMRVVWTRAGDNQWNMTHEPTANLLALIHGGIVDWEAAAARLAQSIRAHHPECLGHLGTATGGTMLFNADYLLQRFVLEAWDRFRTWSPADPDLSNLVDEFEKFVELPTVPIGFFAQLINFRMPATASGVELPHGLVIRRLTEDEMTRIYGTSSIVAAAFGASARPGLVHEYAVAGEFDDERGIGGPPGPPDAIERVRGSLNAVMLALRTFKRGRVGFDTIRLRPKRFVPTLLVLELGNLDQTPFGHYQLEENEIHEFEEHARQLAEPLAESLDIACSRLADAEMRLKPRDTILDAVIGLEAILLAQIGRDDRKGELRYRFSMNYAALFSGANERYRAFRRARDLYDLRSTVAHGSHPKDDQLRLGDEYFTLEAIAQQSTEILRDVIKQFVPNGKSPLYQRSMYWEKAYFGLGENDLAFSQA